MRRSLPIWRPLLSFRSLVAACLPLILTTVYARAAAVDFSIPAQSADKALLAFSSQSRLEVLFPADALSRVSTPELIGRYEATEAIVKLLQGSGFEALLQGRKTILIRATESRDRAHQSVRIPLRQEKTNPALEAEPNKLDPVLVEAGSSQSGRFDRSRSNPIPRTAIGNLDMLRTPDDALPFTLFNRTQISRSGAVNLNEFLQRELLDSDSATRPPEQDGRADIFSAGSSNLTLRGYGADETVVLVNGRRLPEMLTSGREAAPPPPDVNFIPLSLVERVEVLPVSASALYSGNPVGGVINIVLRPDAEITELTAIYTNATGGFDASQSSLSLQHGRSLLGGALRLRLSATATRSTPPTESELGIIRSNQSKVIPLEDRLYRATPNLRSVDNQPLFGPGTSSVCSVAPGADGSGGITALSARQGLRSSGLFDSPAGIANTPNSIDYAYGRRQHGFSTFVSATYDILPWLQLGVDGMISRTVANRGLNVFQGDLILKQDNPLNPFGQDLEITLNETAPLLGENHAEAHLDFSSIVLGALVRLPKEWHASVDVQYGHSLTRYRGLAGTDSEHWQELLDTGFYNPLRDTQVHLPSQAFYDRVLVHHGMPGSFVTLGDYETLDSAFRATNLNLVLPTGASSISLGADYRRNHLAPYSDERRYGDGSLVRNPQEWSGRSLERVSVFGELQAPLIPTRWLPGWIRRIDSDLALRYVVADTANETNLAPTGGFKIDFQGGVALRGTISTSNRMPTPYMSRKINNPDGSVGSGELSYATIYDPVRNQRYSVESQDALNDNLKPESAVTRSIGFIVQRGQVHRVRAAVDFSDTQKSGELAYLEAQQVLNLESLLPGRVARETLQSGDPHAKGLVSSVLSGQFNLAWRRSQNWVSSIDYIWSECLGGSLELYGRWFYYQRYEVQLLPGSEIVDELKNPDGAAPRMLKHRANLSISWSKPSYGFGMDAHYFHSRILPEQERISQGSSHIDSSWQFDAYVHGDLSSLLLRKKSKFRLQAQLRLGNLFNASAPRYANDPSGAGVQTYGDWRGRVYSLSMTASY